MINRNTTIGHAIALLVLAAACSGAASAEIDWQDSPGAPAPAKAGGTSSSGQKDSDEEKCELDDCRENFEARLFLGSAIDSFAARELQTYLNPEASGDTDTFERAVGGVNFAYRLFGDPDPAEAKKKAVAKNTAVGKKPAKAKKQQFWVYGWTLHGVRSTDIDCAKNQDLPTCQDALMVADDPTEQFLFILRNASSLEAALGFRLELMQLQAERDSSSRLYVNAEYGFITVSGDDDDAMDMTKLGLGVMLTEGKYQGSYLEVGRGESQVFETNPSSRWKIDGLIKWDFAKIKNGKVSGITMISIDADGGSGADSIQSYFGLSYTFSGLKGQKKPENGGAPAGQQPAAPPASDSAGSQPQA